MTTNELDITKDIVEKLGGDPDSLPDGLITTHLGAILEHCGPSSGGGGGKELIVTLGYDVFGSGTWNRITAETNMSWADAKAAVLDGSLTKVVVLEYPGDEYGARIHNANIRSTSLDDGMSFSLCIDFIAVNHSGGSYMDVFNRSIIWGEFGDMMGTEKQI